MHEQSIISALMQQVDELRRRNGARRIVEVRVELGPLSGVEPLLLQSAFAWQQQEFSRQHPDEVADSWSAANLVIDHVPLLATCKDCQHQMEILDFVFRCSICQGQVQVTRGDQLVLVSVTLSGEESSTPIPDECHADVDPRNGIESANAQQPDRPSIAHDHRLPHLLEQASRS